jgi:hypothetical protein
VGGEVGKGGGVLFECGQGLFRVGVEVATAEAGSGAACRLG